MKKRLTSLALALCLGATLVTPAFAANTFPDVAENFWAKPYIDDMTQRGLFVGYNDGTFKPFNEMTAIEAFALCARLSQDVDSRRQMETDNKALLDSIFAGEASDWWFRKEAAACITLGIVDGDTLQEMNARGEFYQPMEKQVFAMYLVKAMGLEELAVSASDLTVDFNDAADIDAEYLPYIHLLTQYGVLEGDNLKNFNPTSSINRAICSTMLSRALKQMETRGIDREIARYTTYDFVEGEIVDVDVNTDGTRTLTLESLVSGKHSVTLTGEETIYLYNMPSSATALKAGTYAKVCLSQNGKSVDAIRLTAAGQLQSVSGAVKAYSQERILVGGVKYSIDRFTEVSAGGKTGDKTLIDLEADYEAVEMATDYAGNVLWMKLSGGTRTVDGILTDVTFTTTGSTTKTTVTVAAYNGQETTYEVGSGVNVLVGDAAVTLKESHEGRQVTLRVADDDLSALKAITLNLNDKYIQGVLKSRTTKTEPQKVEITVKGDAKKTPYSLDEGCVVTYMGSETSLDKLGDNIFVTAKVEGGVLTELHGYLGYEDTEGTLTRIDFTADPIRLEVTLESGSVVKFELPIERLDSVAITSGKNDSDITQLRTGDAVVVTALYHDVTQIEHSHKEANVSGTVSALTTRLDGTASITLLLSDGSSVTYTANASTTVTKDSTPVALSTVTVGSSVALVAEGDKAVSIQLSGTATAPQDQLSGVILQKDTTSRTLTLRVTANGETRVQKASVPTSATLVDTKGGTIRSLSTLEVGDSLTLWGSYASDGTFAATLVIRE